jgi:hypothetical protein
MVSVMEERRRAPRFSLQRREAAVLPYSVSVRVLDISLAGVLLQCSQRVNVGARGRLRLNVGGTPVVADVEVRRIMGSPAARDTDYRIGAMFVALSREHRQVIERFTRH